MEPVASPDFQTIVFALFLIGVTCAGLTEIVKVFLRSFCPKLKGIPDPTWWQILLRVIPIAIGGALGYFFMEFPWGLVTGFCAGILMTIIYRKAKQLINNTDTSKGLPLK